MYGVMHRNNDGETRACQQHHVTARASLFGLSSLLELYPEKIIFRNISSRLKFGKFGKPKHRISVEMPLDLEERAI